MNLMQTQDENLNPQPHQSPVNNELYDTRAQMIHEVQIESQLKNEVVPEQM